VSTDRLRLIPGEVIGQIELPGDLAEGRSGLSLRELENIVRRLHRENGRMRSRLATIERLLSDADDGTARRRELRARANSR